MSHQRRAMILKLATTGYEKGLDVLKGVLRRDDRGGWHIDGHPVAAWLEAHEEEEVVLLLGSLADRRPVPVQTCGTCGRDYTDLECPHCRAGRMRLRGRP